MAQVKTEGLADRQTAEGDLEGGSPQAERRVTKHIWRIIPGDQSPDALLAELPWHGTLPTHESPPDHAAHQDQDAFSTTLPQQEAAEPDHGASDDTAPLVASIARFAMQVSTLTDQLSGMAADLIQAERGQAKAERASIVALTKIKAAEARLAEQEACLARQEELHQSELEILRQQHQAEIINAEAAGEHYLAQLQAVRDRALAEIASLKRQRDQAAATLTAFQALPWWRRALSPSPGRRKRVGSSPNNDSPQTT